MTLEEKLVEKVRELPPDKKHAVLEFVKSLEQGGTKAALRSLEGLWVGLEIHITEEDIVQARREMWGNFPRDIEL